MIIEGEPIGGRPNCNIEARDAYGIRPGRNRERTMRSRRSFLVMMSAAAGALAVPARAFEVRPYEQAAAQKAIASGKPVVVHVRASWCLQCRAQDAILDSLKSDPAYAGLTLLDVDYDKQKDVVGRLDCPRATLIAYRGGKEVKRMSWETSREAVLNVLKAAM